MSYQLYKCLVSVASSLGCAFQQRLCKLGQGSPKLVVRKSDAFHSLQTRRRGLVKNCVQCRLKQSSLLFFSFRKSIFFGFINFYICILCKCVTVDFQRLIFLLIYVICVTVYLPRDSVSVMVFDIFLQTSFYFC